MSGASTRQGAAARLDWPTPAATESDLNALRHTLLEGEALTVPDSLRDAMGLRPGDTVIMELHRGESHIRPEKPERAALRRLQARRAPLAPKDGYVSDELIAERRAEAERE